MRTREDLTVEPSCLDLGVLTQGGGVLYEPSYPNLETSSPREKFITDLVLIPQGQKRI